MDSIVQEGFLCPICMKDLGDVVQLQQHFVDLHSQTDKEDAFLPIKGLFDKAKQRLMKFELSKNAEVSEYSVSCESTSSYATDNQQYFFNEEPQELGVTIIHTPYFKKVRDSRIDNFADETNKLLIRLDKLINEAPTEPMKRKAFEKDIIPWVNDSEVQHCRFCGCKFSLTKRKHHCRLCGKIVCAPCSKFLTFAYARKLTNPAFAMEYLAEVERNKAEHNSSDTRKRSSPNLPIKQAERLLMNSLSMLKRDGSEVSVSSLFNQEGEEHLRICSDCRGLLDRRDQQVEQRTQAPIVVQVYERLRLLIEEAERLFPSYCKMAECLNAGESLYDLQTAKDLRVKLVKLQEQIDYVSRKVCQMTNLEAGDESTDESTSGNTPVAGGGAVSSRQVTLQRNIQAFASSFLRDMVVSMPNLPKENEYAELQTKHKAGIETKISNERSAASAAILRATSSIDASSNGMQTSPHRSLTNTQQKMWTGSNGGWTPSKNALTSTLSSLSFTQSDSDQPIDLLREQILLIRGFIKQAAVDGRLEELGMLEKNLHELEQELKIQQEILRTTTLLASSSVDST